jgi:hypothetical protein
MAEEEARNNVFSDLDRAELEEGDMVGGCFARQRAEHGSSRAAAHRASYSCCRCWLNAHGWLSSRSAFQKHCRRGEGLIQGLQQQRCTCNSQQPGPSPAVCLSLPAPSQQPTVT